jgi:hypothetical protein
MVVAIEGPDGSALFQPPLTTKVAAGDGVAVIGRPTRTDAMQAVFGARAQPGYSAGRP